MSAICFGPSSLITSHLETLICSPAQIYQLHFNLDRGKWGGGLSWMECMCESVSAANQRVLSVGLCAEETVTTIILIHSMPVEMSAKWAAARSVSPRPSSCSASPSYSHFLLLSLYVYRSGLISGALIFGVNPPLPADLTAGFSSVLALVGSGRLLGSPLLQMAGWDE